jgi:hypothetical protein
MLDPSAQWLNEVFFPEAISRETEISCPACGAVLTVAVDDPMASQTYQCFGVQAVFKNNWGA